MILAARVIWKQRRRDLECEKCKEAVNEPHLRIYGLTRDGGRPLIVRMHAKCVTRKMADGSPKIGAALKALLDAEVHGTDPAAQ